MNEFISRGLFGATWLSTQIISNRLPALFRKCPSRDLAAAGSDNLHQFTASASTLKALIQYGKQKLADKMKTLVCLGLTFLNLKGSLCLDECRTCWRSSSSCPNYFWITSLTLTTHRFDIAAVFFLIAENVTFYGMIIFYNKSLCTQIKLENDSLKVLYFSCRLHKDAPSAYWYNDCMWEIRLNW